MSSPWQGLDSTGPPGALSRPPTRNKRSSNKADPDDHHSRLALLGTFELRVTRQPLCVPLPGQRLLAFLGLACPADRQSVAGHLWPDATETRASSSLRSALSKLQRLCPDAVVNGGRHLALSPAVQVDVHELRALAGQVIAGNGTALDAALQLLRLGGELLPSWDEEWLIFDREELRHIRLQALECCASRLCRSGQFGAALLVTYEAIRSDPLRESAHRLLVGIHMGQGNRLEALRAARSYSTQLWLDCKARPSPIMEELVRGIRVNSLPSKP
jgi:DNA-binding SARP family transcriptional activator